MKFVKQIPDLSELTQYSLSEKQEKKRLQSIKEIQNILSGRDRRKILIIGPCSADREDAVLDYMEQLARISEKVRQVFMIVPRVYTSKPRTNGLGYKGLLHRPEPETNKDDLLHGLIAARKLHYRVIENTGMFAADEMLYPEVLYYYSDLLSYVAVGARSVENQEHRLVASGLDVPVGMKNPMSGDMRVMLNAISASRASQSMIYHGWVVTTEGNPYSHAILRGYVDNNGNQFSNYHYEDVCKLFDMYRTMDIKNEGVIIDCNHSNSGKHYEEQIRISQEVVQMCQRNQSLNHFVKGLMIESYIEDGTQMIGEGIYGKSITDGCLGLKKTERLIDELAQMLAKYV